MRREKAGLFLRAGLLGAALLCITCALAGCASRSGEYRAGGGQRAQGEQQASHTEQPPCVWLHEAVPLPSRGAYGGDPADRPEGS